MAVPQKTKLIEDNFGEYAARELDDMKKKEMQRLRAEMEQELEKRVETKHHGTCLLSVMLGKDDSIDVESVFQKVSAKDAQMAIASYAPKFLNEVFSHGKKSGDSVRIFMQHFTAALVAAYPNEDTNAMLDEFVKCVEYYKGILERKR